MDFSPLPAAATANKNITPTGDVSEMPAIVRIRKQPRSEIRGTIPSQEKELLIGRSAPRFYKSSEVSHISQLQLPLEGALFTDERSLSGRLVLDIAVSDLGSVVNIEVIEASDLSGALRAYMLPMLKAATYTAAYKDGRPVNSIRRVEFTLGIALDEPRVEYKSSEPLILRPRMDERGNILKPQPKP